MQPSHVECCCTISTTVNVRSAAIGSQIDLALALMVAVDSHLQFANGRPFENDTEPSTS